MDFMIGVVATMAFYLVAYHQTSKRHESEVRYLRAHIAALRERHGEVASGLREVALSHPVYGPRLRAIDGGKH